MSNLVFTALILSALMLTASCGPHREPEYSTETETTHAVTLELQSEGAIEALDALGIALTDDEISQVESQLETGFETIILTIER